MGYRLIARNVRLHAAEIDLVAWEGQVLCVVEVRARRHRAWGRALASVDGRKRARLVRAAGLLLAQWPEPWPPVRFDVVTVEACAPPTITLWRAAFEAP